MPMRQEDLDRLPPMINTDEVAEKQRLEDLKAFRRYLADSGVVKCLVQLYQHTAKTEMRLDNPAVVRDFLAAYQSEHPDAEEIMRLSRENATLREYNEVLAGQLQDLSQQAEAEQPLHVGRTLWHRLVHKKFWQGAPGGQVPPAGGLTLGQLFLRLCGCAVDERTGQVLVELLRPPALSGEQASVELSKDSFVEWVAHGMPEDMHEWVRDELLPRLQLEPPFERELLEELREHGLYPENLGELAKVVELPSRLRAFLEDAAQQLGS